MRRLMLFFMMIALTSGQTTGMNLQGYHQKSTEVYENKLFESLSDKLYQDTIRKEINDLMTLTITTTYYVDNFSVKVIKVEARIEIKAGQSGYEYLKAIVAKEDEYIYNIVKEVESLPLQMGSGTYKVSLLGSTDNRRFRQLSVENITVELEEFAVFLNSTQNITWTDESEAVIIARELTKDLETDLEKLEVIHKYVISNVRYDYQKATQLPKGYIPNPEETLEEGLGICYDFSSLFASMLRAVEIPTKLIKGYSAYTPVYHAWNEVLIDDEWYVVDTSTDSIFYDYDVRYKIRKDDEDYLMSKEY